MRRRKQYRHEKHLIQPMFCVWKHCNWNFVVLAMPFSVVVAAVVEIVVGIVAVAVDLLETRMIVVEPFDAIQRELSWTTVETRLHHQNSYLE